MNKNLEKKIVFFLKNFIWWFSAPQVQGEDPMAALSKGFGNALSFGSSFIQKAASVTKDNAVKIGNAAAHAGGEIGKKAADGSLTNQGSAVLGSAFGKYKLVFLSRMISV